MTTRERLREAAWLGLLLAALALEWAGGYLAGRMHPTPRPPAVQNANDLLDAGFTIIDPEGFEVDRFDQ